MSSYPIARGQVTINVLQDSYTITQTVSEYIFPASSAGVIQQKITFASVVSVTEGNSPVNDFTIGSIARPAGFASVTVNNSAKSVTYTVNANTSDLADSGALVIPLIIKGVTYNVSFAWSKAKQGEVGPATEATLPGWLEEWDTGKTQINGDYVITPKLYAGVKNANGTITGVALGELTLSARDNTGAVVAERLTGVYGFRDGYRTFSINTSGDVELGRGEQSIKYNAVTGKIEFGAGVSLNWKGATYIDNNGIFTGRLSANTVTSLSIDASQITTGKISSAFIDTASLKSALITAGNIQALTLNIGQGKIGGWNIDDTSLYTGVKSNSWNSFTAEANAMTIGSRGIRGNKWRLESDGSGALAGNNISWDKAGNVTLRPVVTLKWDTEINLAKELASAMAFGKMLYRYPEFYAPNGVSSNGTRTYLLNVQLTYEHVEACPNTTGYCLVCTATDWNLPNNYRAGGFGFRTQSRPNAVFISRLIAKIPCGAKLNNYTNPIGDGYKIQWLTSQVSTGNWQEYVCKVTCGATGTFSTTNFFALTDTEVPTAENPVIWEVAYATVFDVTACEKYTTTINEDGIYTGTLRAEQITAGSIKADRLDAATLKANIVNAGYINSLECSFTKGTIGGWKIDGSSMSCGALWSSSPRIQMRTAASGRSDGYWASGSYNPYGISLTWRQESNGGHIVLGEIASTANSLKSGFMGLQMMDYAGKEYFCLSANFLAVGKREVYNRIAGWAFNDYQIWKNHVVLGSDGSIRNGEFWHLNNDGSGKIAAGNISWSAAGEVTFSSEVSLSWKNDIQKAKTENLGYPYYYRLVINGEDDKYYPVVFKGGDQNIKRDILIKRPYAEQAPVSWTGDPVHLGNLSLLIKVNFGSMGGAQYSWDIYELSEMYCRMFGGAEFCGSYTMFSVFLRGGGSEGAVYHIYSNQPLVSKAYSSDPIPASPQIAYNSDQILKYNSYELYAPAARVINASVEKEISDRLFIPLAKKSANTLDRHPLTHIDSAGIYTGTLTAQQVNAVQINAQSIKTGYLSSDRLAADSITAVKLNAASIKAEIINTDYINGLSCSFVQGFIGGWSIDADGIRKGSFSSTESATIQLRSVSSGSGYWYNGSYRPLGISLCWVQNQNAGHLVLGQVALDGTTPKQNYYGIQMMSWNGNEYFCLSANCNASGSMEVYNRIAGWAFDHSTISKNNVTLGGDGSITNGTRWQLNNDGSGRIAGGNISWTSSGAVTFSDNVSLQWTGLSLKGKIIAQGIGLGTPKPATVAVEGNILVNLQKRGLTLVLLKKATCQPVFARNYDTYKNDVTCNELARELNALNDEFVVIIVSYEAFTISPMLNEAIERCGGMDLPLEESTGAYAMIGIPGCGKNNGLTSYRAEGKTAELSTYLEFGSISGMYGGSQKTYIDGNGVYTGSVHARQIMVDSSLVVGNHEAGKIEVRDANDVVKVTLDRTGINAVAGKIGGWILEAGALSSSGSNSSQKVCLGNKGVIFNLQNGAVKWLLGPDGTASFGGGKIAFYNDGSGYMANRNITWNADGQITAKGTIRSPFVFHDTRIWTEDGDSQTVNLTHYDHIVAIQTSSTLSNVTLPWTLEHSGRRICLINYKWNNTVTQGYMKMTAPSGKYFFEDGVSKSQITFSRELIELVGYGDDKKFLGWIVVNRRDIMTDGRYGSYQQILASGRVTGSATGATIFYSAFDGSTLTVSRLELGRYRVFMPTSWNLNGMYFVMLTGIYTTGPIYPTLKSQYSYYFDVDTQDDPSRNEGAFNFQVYSTFNWNHPK